MWSNSRSLVKSSLLFFDALDVADNFDIRVFSGRTCLLLDKKTDSVTGNVIDWVIPIDRIIDFRTGLAIGIIDSSRAGRATSTVTSLILSG